MQKPAENPKQASMAAKRKALIAAKAQPVATVQPTADPSLFSLGQEAKAFAARVDAGFKSSVGKLASVTPSIEATEPRQKAVVGSPGAQGLPGPVSTGIFAFEIVGDELICTYTGTTAPELVIDGSGDLILTL